MSEHRLVSVIVLTMGDRPEELDKLVASLQPQQPFDGVLIGNGVTPRSYPGWRSISLERNVGIAAGRAIGADEASGEVLVFLDDDACVVSPDLVERCQHAFATQPDLGAIAMRVVVEGTTRSLSEWQPRLRGVRQDDAGDVTWFAGGAHAVRASAYHQCGGYDRNFWYAHEETDLAWRLLDRGYRIAYEPDLVVSHPFATPARHRDSLWYSARNRVWVARKHLPIPLAVLYCAMWLVVQLGRCRAREEVAHVLRGSWAGMTHGVGPRQPMRWRTVLTMTRLGRPPII